MTARKLSWLLIMVVALFTIVITSMNVNADEAKDCVEIIKSGNSIYAYMKCDGSAHIYWATYNIEYNHGSIKTNEGSHSNRYMDPKNRPFQYDDKGDITPDYLRWISKLNYTHLTKKGEKLVFLDQSGLNNASKTEKSGKYFVYIWANDQAHGRYIYWCNINGVNLSWR